jgi:hypothetical protein
MFSYMSLVRTIKQNVILIKPALTIANCVGLDRALGLQMIPTYDPGPLILVRQEPFSYIMG